MTDKSIEREIEFTDWWYFHNKKAPTYADAIEWADKTMIDKACEWLMKYFVLDHEGMSPSGFGVFEYMFRKAMEGEV